MAGGSFHGRESFQPGKIVTQIVSIHLFFYATFVRTSTSPVCVCLACLPITNPNCMAHPFLCAQATLLFVVNHTLGVASIYSLRRTGPLILDQMLSHRALSLRRSPGLAAAFSFAVSFVLCGSLAFVKIVGRARRALDFATTMFVTHLVCCTLYGGIPTSLLWWAINLTCMAAMTVMCEVLSRRIELREIAVPGRERDIEAAHPDDEDDAARPS